MEREVSLSSSKYFNQKLLNYSQKVFADSDYIFFVHSFTQKINLQDQIEISMKKVTPGQLAAGMLSCNFDEAVRNLMAIDKVFIGKRF